VKIGQGVYWKDYTFQKISKRMCCTARREKIEENRIGWDQKRGEMGRFQE